MTFEQERRASELMAVIRNSLEDIRISLLALDEREYEMARIRWRAADDELQLLLPNTF